MEKSCSDCHFITSQPACPACGGTNFVDKWKGVVYVFDAPKSIIAEKMGITLPGKYALKLR